MDPKQLFAKAIEHAAGCIRHIEPGQLTNSTPCTEWDLKQLLNHMVNELLWVPELLRGKTIAEVGTQFDGDVVGGDAAGTWQRAADAALVAVKRADLNQVVHLSYGDFPASHYIAEMATDVLLHGWDASQSIKCNLLFEPDLAQAVYEQLAPNAQSYHEAGLMAAPIDVPANARIETKLLALAGRRERMEA